MSKWKSLILTCVCATVVLAGCNSSSNEETATNDVEETERRTNFGDNYIETDDVVVYLHPNKDLYMYHHENREEFLVDEDVGTFDIYDNHVFYIATDGFISELDLPLQAIYKANILTGESKKVLASTEENDAYTTPRNFYMNKDGYIALETEVGYLHSNYWSIYTMTDTNFSFNNPMLTLESDYDFVPNEIQWQDDKVFFLIEKIEELNDDGLHTELRSYSIKDGEQVIQERALPLSSEEYEELFNHIVYIGVEDSILYMSGVDDDQVEQISYEIDLDTHEVLHKTPDY